MGPVEPIVLLPLDSSPSGLSPRRRGHGHLLAAAETLEGSGGSGETGRWQGLCTIASVQIRCAECGCVVDAGARVRTCGDNACCCADLPVAGDRDPRPVEPAPEPSD